MSKENPVVMSCGVVETETRHNSFYEAIGHILESTVTLTVEGGGRITIPWPSAATLPKVGTKAILKIQIIAPRLLKT